MRKFNDFGVSFDDYTQEITHRIEYIYSTGGKVSSPAVFDSLDDVVRAALYSELGTHLKKDAIRVDIFKYDYSTGCKLFLIKSINL